MNQDGSILPARDFSLGPERSKIIFVTVLSHIINLLLTNLVRSRWLDIGLVLFVVFMDLDFVSVHKQAKNNLVNIQPS